VDISTNLYSQGIQTVAELGSWWREVDVIWLEARPFFREHDLRTWGTPSTASLLSQAHPRRPLCYPRPLPWRKAWQHRNRPRGMSCPACRHDRAHCPELMRKKQMWILAEKEMTDTWFDSKPKWIPYQSFIRLQGVNESFRLKTSYCHRIGDIIFINKLLHICGDNSLFSAANQMCVVSYLRDWCLICWLKHLDRALGLTW